MAKDAKATISTSMGKATALSGPGTPHPEYEAGRKRWERVRACYQGSDAVKAGKTRWLPKPEGMTDPDYKKYILRAEVLPAVDKTEEVLSGILFREPPEIEGAGVEDFLKDVTLTKQPLEGFAADTVGELLVAGRVGILMDFAVPPAGGQVRPYWNLRQAEEIVSWRTRQAVDGHQQLVRVALVEVVLVENPDKEYALMREHRVREYVLEDGRVVVRVHAIRKGKWVIVEERTPMVHGQPLEAIPFLLANARSVGVRIIKPPLLAIADGVLSHYRSSADLEQGNYYASLPVPWIQGGKLPRPGRRAEQAVGPVGHLQTHGSVTRPAEGYRLGSNTVLELPPDATMGYLEIKGPGLASIHKTMMDKKANLKAMGARLLDDAKKQPETAQTARIKAQGDASLLRLVANVTDQLLTTALQTCAEWMGLAAESMAVKLNREYLEVPESEGTPNLDISDWPMK